MGKALWRSVPLLLFVAVAWWGSQRATGLFKGGIEDSANQRAEQLLKLADDELAPGEVDLVGDEIVPALEMPQVGTSLRRFAEVFALKDLVILLVVVVGVVWSVKWLRHRSLMRYLREAGDRKQALERHLTVARERAHETHAAARAATVPRRPAAPVSPPPEPVVDEASQKVLADAHALLASHLATELALQGATASPERTVRLLRKAGVKLAERWSGRRGHPDDAYVVAAELGQEVRRLITSTPRYLEDPQTQRVADALVAVIRVLDGGAEGSWACDTIEGFVLGVQDVDQARAGSRKFANDHGPMARAFGAVTSPKHRKPPLPTGDTGEHSLVPHEAPEGGGEVPSTFLERARERQQRSRRS